MSNVLTELVAKIKADTSQLEKSLDSADKKTSNFGKSLAKIGTIAVAAGAAAAAGIAVIVTKTAQAGDEIAKMADKTGMSTEALSEWRYMAELGGTSLSAVEVAVKKMSGAIEDAKDGLATYTRIFEKLGIDLKELEGMSTEKAFNRITQAVAEVEDPIQRAALAMDLFGRSGTDLLPILEQGVEGMEEQKQKAHELGIVFSADAAQAAEDFNDSITNLKATFGGLAVKLSGALMPTLTSLIDNLSGIIQAMQPVMDIIAKAASKVFPILGEAIGALIEIVTPLIDAILPIFISLWDNIVIILSPVIDILKFLFQVLTKVIGALSPIVESLLPLFAKVIAPLIGLVADLLDALMPLIDLGLTILVGVLELVLDILTPVIDAVSTFIGWIADGLTTIVGFIANALKPLINFFSNFKESIVNIWENIVEFFRGIWDKIAGVFSNAWNNILDFFEGIFESIGNFFKTAWDKVVGFFKGVWDKVKGFFQSIGEAIWNAIKGAINFAIDIINHIIDIINMLPFVDIGHIEHIGAGAIREFSNQEIIEMQYGGIVTQPTLALVGEVGPEAIVPLSDMMVGGITINFTEPVFFDREDQLNSFAEKIRKAIRRQDRINYGRSFEG